MRPSPRRMYVCKASAGTGKTYTLAAHYIALLMNGVASKNILAVTFTNKATAEMKQRIITYLHAIATRCQEPETQAFLACVRDVSSKVRSISTFTDEEYASKSQELLLTTMSNFDDLSICTIDSFLQTLLTGLAQAIGQTAGFGIDLDSHHAITKAVDEVLSEEVNEAPHIRCDVVNRLNTRLMNEEKWDLRPGLIRLVEELYKENVQEIREQIPLASDAHPGYRQLIQTFSQQLDRFKSEPSFLQLKAAYECIAPLDNRLSEETGGRSYHSFFKKCSALCSLAISSEVRLGTNDLNRLTKPDRFTRLTPSEVALLYEKITLINQLSEQVRKSILRRKIYKEYLDDLLLAGYVVDRIKKDQRENNSVLLAETASTLIRALDRHDAQFILLKAGIRYRHIMLDEFQDTSSLQWKNFKHLIEEILSNIGGSALIVGDIKQSIYRWRNGDYEIMNNLDKPQQGSLLHEYYNSQNLSRNFRSRKEIVQFNLETFQQLAERESALYADIRKMYDEQYKPTQLDSFYNTKKDGGYVHIEQFDGGNTKQDNEQATEHLTEYMFQQMEDLLEHGYQNKDMLILCRASSEVQKVLKHFKRLIADAERFPKLREAGQIVSNDSFLLESSEAVNTIISGLKVVAQQDEIARYYLLQHYPDMDMSALDKLSKQSPFSDIVEQITRLTLCQKGDYKGSDIAHLNCLRDKILSYIGKYGSDIDDFLLYWDDKMHKDSIPASASNDIRIMTIHSSKGLQAKNVFIPFTAWKQEQDGSRRPTLWCEVADIQLTETEQGVLPVSYNKSMGELEDLKDYYESERIKQHIDALNLLYVACTRAEDNLFILVSKTSRTGETAGKWLIDLYGSPRSFGTLYYPSTSQQAHTVNQEPFSFEQAQKLPAHYRCNHTQIAFRQSRATQQMMHPNEQMEENAENIAFGNLCHAILEQIQTRADVERVVNDFYLRGNIPNAKDKRQISQLIERLVNHPIAQEWFDGSWRLLREDTIISIEQGQVEEKRIDRAMIKGEQVVVLDYKFGKKMAKHTTQVADYMQIMHQMGYSNVKGYLWYGYQGQLEEVTKR